MENLLTLGRGRRIQWSVGTQLSKGLSLGGRGGGLGDLGCCSKSTTKGLKQDGCLVLSCDEKVFLLLVGTLG